MTQTVQAPVVVSTPEQEPALRYVFVCPIRRIPSSADAQFRILRLRVLVVSFDGCSRVTKDEPKRPSPAPSPSPFPLPLPDPSLPSPPARSYAKEKLQLSFWIFAASVATIVIGMICMGIGLGGIPFYVGSFVGWLVYTCIFLLALCGCVGWMYYCVKRITLPTSTLERINQAYISVFIGAFTSVGVIITR